MRTVPSFEPIASGYLHCSDPIRPVRLRASMLRISAAESKSEFSRARKGAVGPTALRRCAIGITCSRLKSDSLDGFCTPGRRASSRQKPSTPR